MKLRIIYSLLMVSCLFGVQFTQGQPSFEMVESDPMQTRIYTLDNGMRLYLSLNEDKPRIQTSIAVRAGSKNDPADNTGLAHYLEHMLFKGNSEIASQNWEEEKKLLDQISDLYEKHKATKDDAAKKVIYKQIDSLSYLAAKQAIPNEYDKLVSSLGAKGTNAYTSNERTVYINDIPTVELEKWMHLESSRFSELTLRLFHTELETVYEEFNRGQDNDKRKVYYAMLEMLFPTHQYGTQTTIGEGEHLKNPSMVKIHEYFDTYYVPNNMAICLSGDLDFDQTYELANKYFGKWEMKEVPVYEPPQEQPIKKVIEREVFGPSAENVSIGFRLNGAQSDDALMLKLIDGILSNGQAGLIDLNLVQQQRVLSAYSNPRILKDYSYLYLSAEPKQGQSLEEAKDLLLEQVDMIKNGAFEDWLIEAVINDMKLRETRYYEYNAYRNFKMIDAFIYDMDWGMYVQQYDRMREIDKNRIMEFAHQNFRDNFCVVYKRVGEDPSLHKVNKPEITPIDIERDKQSKFAEEFSAMKESRLEPKFLDYQNDIHHSQMGELPFKHITNTSNDLFQMMYIFEMGSDHDKELAFAIEYLPFLGTSEYSAEALSKEFFKLGVSFDVFVSNDRIYVTLDGLEESLAEGTKLFEHLLANAVPDEPALKELINNTLKSRDDNKKNKGVIHRKAMMQYAKYGSKNPMNTILNEEDLRELEAEKLAERIRKLNNYKHIVFYYGSMEPENAKTLISKFHRTTGKFNGYPESEEFKQVDNKDNRVYFVNYDMVQTELLMISKSQQFNPDVLAYGSIFNEYFGAGLSSIVFQEIRESKALAYSAYAYYSNPRKKEESHYVNAYIGTQTDKLPDAVNALLELMKTMPKANDQFEDARLAALKKIETDRITKTSIFWNYMTAERLGLDHDTRKERYEQIKTMTLDDLNTFFNSNISGRNYAFLVIGKKEDVDFDALNKLGKVKELKLEEIFGY